MTIEDSGRIDAATAPARGQARNASGQRRRQGRSQPARPGQEYVAYAARPHHCRARSAAAKCSTCCRPCPPVMTAQSPPSTPTPRATAMGRLEMMMLLSGVQIPHARDASGKLPLGTQHHRPILLRLSDGSRKVMRISEISGMEGEMVMMQDLFEFRRTGIGPRRCLARLSPPEFAQPTHSGWRRRATNSTAKFSARLSGNYLWTF